MVVLRRSVNVALPTKKKEALSLLKAFEGGHARKDCVGLDCAEGTTLGRSLHRRMTCSGGLAARGAGLRNHARAARTGKKRAWPKETTALARGGESPPSRGRAGGGRWAST